MSASATFDDVLAAARRLEGVAIRTPLLENARVNARLGGRLFIKAECLQRTGSFKLRGAYNFLASMSEADRKKGVVGWSSGNHAQGLAEAARLMGMKATIVMPADAPALKIANTKASGAEVVLHDRVKDSREEIGMGIAKKTGATVVPPYDHPWILTGQGTAGLEIVEQAKALGVTLDAVAAPCSGGGLSTGIALAVKGLSPNTSVHAGEPAGFDDLARSLAAGTKQKNDKLSGSICDALLAPTPGDVTFPIAKQLLGPGLVVTDDEVLDAMETGLPRIQAGGRAGRRRGAGGRAHRQAAGEGPRRRRGVLGRQCRPRDVRAGSRAPRRMRMSNRSRNRWKIFFWLSARIRGGQRVLRRARRRGPAARHGDGNRKLAVHRHAHPAARGQGPPPARRATPAAAADRALLRHPRRLLHDRHRRRPDGRSPGGRPGTPVSRRSSKAAASPSRWPCRCWPTPSSP